MLKACVAVVVVEFCEAETVDVPAVATFCETEIIGDPATFWEFQTAGVSSSWSDVIDLVTKYNVNANKLHWCCSNNF